MPDEWTWRKPPLRPIPQSAALADRHRQPRFEGHDCPTCKGWHADWWQSTVPPGCRRGR